MSIYELTEREQCSAIVDLLDDPQGARDFERCRFELGQLDASRLSAAGVVSVLGITKAAAELLQPERSMFFDAACRRIAELRGDDAVLPLLAKYR